MSGRVLVWAGVGAAVVAAVVLAVFWLVQGLEQAGWLAGVLGAFAALAAFVVALPLRPGPSGPESEAERPGGESAGGAGGQSSAGATGNTFSGGTNAGPLVMGRDISGPVTSGLPVPPAAPPPPAAPTPPSNTESGSAPGREPEAEPAEGTVSNTFSGGTNYGPLVMGRDISGPIAGGTPAPGAAQPSPAARQAARGTPEEPSGEATGSGSPERSGDEPAAG